MNVYDFLGGESKVCLLGLFLVCAILERGDANNFLGVKCSQQSAFLYHRTKNGLYIFKRLFFFLKKDHSAKSIHGGHSLK